MMTSEKSSTNEKQTFSMKDLICQRVVVYTDRAEVQRLLKATIKHGETELIINNVTSFIDQDSVRVEGHGAASVLDVVCQNKRVETSESTSHDRVKQLQNEIKELEAKRETVQYKLNRAARQENTLNDFATSLSKPGGSGDSSKDSSKRVSTSKETVENFLSFLDLYGQKLETLDDNKLLISKEINKINEQINVAQENLNKLNISQYNESTEVTILIETAEKSAEVELKVSYVVYNASWTPKYDIRVFSKDKSMVINYFGMITQSTNEDWNDTKLSLSTAVPSIGGCVPELETQNVRIKPKYVPHFNTLGKVARPKRMLKKIINDEESENCYDEDEGGFGGGIQEKYKSPIAMVHAKVEAGITASTFDIPRTASIPADNNTHKVSIGLINLKPDFEYESVPKKNAHAFIKAKVINSSEYAMLAGPANVFFDNNFVAKTQLKSYSPQEEFTCSLGVDPAIRVDYKPVRKFKAQTGFIMGKLTTTSYVQVIEIKNTTANSIKILVVDNLPQSNDANIKIKLTEPVIKSSSNITINKSNNLEFDLVIPSGKKEELTIKYSVEHPPEEEIEFF